MKKTLLAVVPLFLLCGCLSPAPVAEVSYWLVEFRNPSAGAESPKYGIARLSQVVVDQPYAGDRLVVLRRNGTVAFDAHNVYAAPPSSLLRGVGLSALKASGLFADAVGAGSGASASVSVELVVSRLALDCRQEDVRRAVAEVLVRVLSGKTVVGSACGEGAADASDGDYGVAFSKAVSESLSTALSRLR